MVINFVFHPAAFRSFLTSAIWRNQEFQRRKGFNAPDNMVNKETDIVKWKVEGMDCTTCALNISKYLEKDGLKNVKVNFATGDLLFDEVADEKKEKIAKLGHIKKIFFKYKEK